MQRKLNSRNKSNDESTKANDQYLLCDKLQPKYLSEKRKVVNVPRMTEDLAIKRKKVTQTNEMICFSSFFIGDTKKPNRNKNTPLSLMAEMKLKNFKLTRVFTHILQTGRG